MSGPKLKSCPGVGHYCNEIRIKPRNGRFGRGVCPLCRQDVMITTKYKVNYHTSHLSEPREDTDVASL